MTDKSQNLAVVVDDEQDIRDMARIALESSGWRVRVATNGREGLAQVREQLPDLIIVDLMMSGMTGLEFCHRLIAELGATDVPVLLISGVSERAKLLQDFWELPLRYKNFLRKPFGAFDLLKAVQGMMPRFKPSPLKPPARQSSGPGGEPPIGPATSAPPEPPPWMRPAQPRPVEPPKAAAPASPFRTRPTEDVFHSATPTPLSRPDATILPRAVPASASPAASAKQDAPSEPRTGYRILVMDDEPDIRMVMSTALSMYHTVETAENGMEGLRKLDEFLPDFVLSDINMPVMNGLDTAEAIRRHPVMFRVPIFFLTAETGKDMPRRAYDVGGNLFLRKPIDPVRLLKYIDYFLSETKLEPGHYLKRGAAGASSPGAVASAKGGPAPAGGAPRILTVDFNIENQRIIKKLLGDGGSQPLIEGGPFELLWTEDPRAALGNLTRWEPDLILYNPRNPGVDGVAFGQTLRLQKTVDQMVALIGTRFYEADQNYAQRVFKTSVIDLGMEEALIRRKLEDLLNQLRGRVKPKRFDMGQLHEEEVERQRELQSTNAKAARERESFRQRYSKIQQFIDSTNLR